MDFSQFGRWLAEHQAQLVRELHHQQQEAQAAMLHHFDKTLESLRTAPTTTGPPAQQVPWQRL